MSKLSAKRQREILAERHRIHNDHNLARTARELFPEQFSVFVYYRTQTTGRAALTAAWQVIRPGYRTDDDPHPYYRNHGQKTFNVFYVRRDKEPQLRAAIAWASEHYGFDPDEWVKTPFGSYMPSSVLDPVLKELLTDA